MVCVCVCMWVYTSFIYCLQPQATFLFLTPLCTGTNVNVSPTITPPPSCFPLSLFLSLPFAPSPPRNLPQALHLSGLSACFFIWLVATGGSTLADYNSAASHFRFIRAPLPLCTPPQPATLTTLASINPDTQQFLITPMPNTPPPSSVPSHQPYLPPSISAENLARMPQDKKKREKYCGSGSIQVREAASAVLLLRPLSLVMTQESGEYRSCVTQGIQQIALTKPVGAFNSKVSSLGWYPGENSNCALFHGGF